MKSGDVILHANRQPIVASVNLPAQVGMAKPGDRLSLEVWGQGRAERINATSGGLKEKRPDGYPAGGASDVAARIVG